MSGRGGAANQGEKSCRSSDIMPRRSTQRARWKGSSGRRRLHHEPIECELRLGSLHVRSSACREAIEERGRSCRRNEGCTLQTAGSRTRNRSHLNEDRGEFSRARSPAVICVMCERPLKSVTDTPGPQAGDEVLESWRRSHGEAARSTVSAGRREEFSCTSGNVLDDVGPFAKGCGEKDEGQNLLPGRQLTGRRASASPAGRTRR